MQARQCKIGIVCKTKKVACCIAPSHLRSRRCPVYKGGRSVAIL